MSGTERCDEILRMIDEVLGEDGSRERRTEPRNSAASRD